MGLSKKNKSVLNHHSAACWSSGICVWMGKVIFLLSVRGKVERTWVSWGREVTLEGCTSYWSTQEETPPRSLSEVLRNC